ncbi:MAG: hypothetical protein IKD81_08945 [Eubacteriaceae bacterium]|nr:hypothetical protein [Eubacteriaceae bacterium]
MEDFVVELAGVPCRIKCRFTANRDFLKDYLSERAPLFTVEPTDEDLRRMQTNFDLMNEAGGIPARSYSDRFLENNAIHELIAEKMTKHGVLLMHGSALCMDGEGYIFTAASGTGKSTHVRLWRELFGDRVTMINDDKPLIRIAGGTPTVYGTPWDGKHHLSSNASAPLKAVIWLTRDETNHIERMGKAEAFPVIIKQIYRSSDPARMTRIMELEKVLLYSVDLYRLGCNMSPEAAMTAWRGMNEQIS